MTTFKKFFETLRSGVPSDNGFETYYGMIVRNQGNGGPSAAEARRDYQTVRESLNRIAFF
jgi:hypothetical protein